MNEQGRIIGLGVPLVDYKIRKKSNVFPTKKDDLITLAETQKDVVKKVGGLMPNALISFIHMSDHPNVKLLSRIGNDERGMFLSKNIDQRLGSPQIDKIKPTGICVTTLDTDGRFIKNLSFSYPYAGEEVSVNPLEIQEYKNKLFITDIYSSKLPNMFQQAEIVLDQVIKDN
jgi:hypothetical protein